MKRPTTMEILTHLGMVGTPMSTNSLVARSDTPGSQQKQYEQFLETGEVANPDVWSKYAQILKRPQTLDGQYQVWDEMANWDLVQAALVEIVDEAIQEDSHDIGPIWYECNNGSVEDDINRMLEQIGAAHLLPSQFWYVASMGNHFEKIDYAPRDGVRGLSFVHPMDIRRFWLERNRQCIGFRWQGHEPNKEDVFVRPDNQTPIERATLSHSSAKHEDLYYPWDFLHFRRLFRLRDTEHGEPLFEEAQGIYRKLRIALDQMVVHRAQVQPDRYLVNIDTQDLPPTEQFKTVNRWRQSFRNKVSFGQGSGSSDLSAPDSFKSFYNPLALDTIIYMARPRGFQHGIEKLAGTTQIPDVFDIELLIDLFFSIIGMPKSWLFGSQGDGQNPPSGKALLAQNIRFLRKVKSLRRPVINGYTWLAYFHCLLKGHSIESLNIRCKMSDISGLEDQMKADVVKTQVEILGLLGDIMVQYNLPKEAWIELVFKKYLHLPDDVVNVLVTSLPPEEARPQVPESMSTPSERRLLVEISNRLRDPEALPLLNTLKNQVRTLTRASQEETLSDRSSVDRSRIIVPPSFLDGDRMRISMVGGEVYKVSTVESDSGPKVKLTEAADSESGPPPTRAHGVAVLEGSESSYSDRIVPTGQRWRKFIK